MKASLTRVVPHGLPPALAFRGSQLMHRVRKLRAPTPSTAAAIDRLAEHGGRGEPGARPVFVLGSGWRTGSTHVQRMINQTGEILVWGEPYSEGAVVQRLCESLTFLDPVAGRFHAQVLPDDGKLPSPEVWTANLTPPVAHLAAAQRAMVDRLFAVPATEHGCARWGVKEVVWGRDPVHLLSALYPDARFVLLVRDPVAQWRSYRPRTRSPWYYRWPSEQIGSPAAFARMWRRLAEDFLALEETLPGATLVRYEDLKDPAELERLTEFLDLDVPLRAGSAPVGSSRENSFFTESPPQWENSLVRRLTAGTARKIYA